MVDNQKTLQPIVGFDDVCDVFFYENYVFRGVYKGYGPIYKMILDICNREGLFDFGLINTYIPSNHPLTPDEYDIILQHPKLDRISYPFEWPSVMLKDAAIFLLTLTSRLFSKGLFLKDLHPYNIVYSYSKPYFIDFSSIVPFANLSNTHYLAKTSTRKETIASRIFSREGFSISKIIQRTYIPYVLNPLYWYANNGGKKVHQRLYETAINTSPSTIQPIEALKLNPATCKYLKYMIRNNRLFIDKSPRIDQLLVQMIDEVENLNVAPKTSDYLNYYELKGEDRDFSYQDSWNYKQKNVFRILRRYKPKTVLDLGCNTGWYSLLANSLGSAVIATDIDEACLCKLYKEVKVRNLNILPLYMDFSKIFGDKYPPIEAFNDKPKIPKGIPIIQSQSERLQSDLVLVLALLHHLTLGAGNTFAQVFEKIIPFVRRYLILEFVSFDDPAIINEPSFFPAYSRNKQSFSWYSLENLLDCMSIHFTHIEKYESHPKQSRILILGEK